jgi:hypothetical protein
MLEHISWIENESRERYQARLDEREHDRLVRSLRGERAPAHHQLAQLCGRALVSLGAALLHYGRAEDTSIARMSV